jgi:hypothetical protein
MPGLCFSDTDISELIKRALRVEKVTEVRRRLTKNDAKILQSFASIGSSYYGILSANENERHPIGRRA